MNSQRRHMPKFRLRILVLLLLVALVSAACGDNAEVGEGVDTEGGGSGNLSIGEETTTTAAPAITVPTTQAPPPTTAAPTTTARPTTTTTTAPKDTGFPIEINGDNSNKPQFDPPSAAVAVGTVVRFINNDTEDRSVVAQSGAFRSPVIPPGGSWSYKATQPGEYNYQDGTRPYAVGRLEVR